MNQQISPIEGRRNLCASMYEHYNQLILQMDHRTTEELAFRIQKRNEWEQKFLDITPLEAIANLIPITPINGHGQAPDIQN